MALKMQAIERVGHDSPVVDPSGRNGRGYRRKPLASSFFRFFVFPRGGSHGCVSASTSETWREQAGTSARASLDRERGALVLWFMTSAPGERGYPVNLFRSSAFFSGPRPGGVLPPFRLSVAVASRQAARRRRRKNPRQLPGGGFSTVRR
jgi:hypothetical protein